MMLEQRIRALANEIVDPCSSAQAFPIGLVDMGLLLAVELAPAAAPGGAGAAPGGRVDVRLRLRTTAPGCFFVVFFERELRARIEALPEVASLALDWDAAWGWTPDDMAPAAREALAERRRRLLASAPPSASGCGS
jgi:metal-sulfur cluster biosynthetic enzyme